MNSEYFESEAVSGCVSEAVSGCATPDLQNNVNAPFKRLIRVFSGEGDGDGADDLIPSEMFSSEFDDEMDSEDAPHGAPERPSASPYGNADLMSAMGGQSALENFDAVNNSYISDFGDDGCPSSMMSQLDDRA